MGASLFNKIDHTLISPLDFSEQQYPCELQYESPQLNQVRDIIKLKIIIIVINNKLIKLKKTLPLAMTKLVVD